MITYIIVVELIFALVSYMGGWFIGSGNREDISLRNFRVFFTIVIFISLNLISIFDT